MGAPHIILDCLPSLCQKLSDLVEVWRGYNKNNFACFLLRHGVLLDVMSLLVISYITYYDTCFYMLHVATNILLFRPNFLQVGSSLPNTVLIWAVQEVSCGTSLRLTFMLNYADMTWRFVTFYISALEILLMFFWGWSCACCVWRWFTVQTDDKGVFATSLSREYAVAAETFGLSQQNLWDLSYDSINYVFADDGVKEQLRTSWNQMKSRCFQSYM